ncbi:PREDICTED: uncharacterized protein LOC109219167 [Nicotiana attenuata]|uniref:uncharacterized protein LOC109219167 n=1 Tax=Nicotiana attenuata TaxID=49451 RepID=UPI000905A58D|nr:PREDICTED: uncharacterized protein LOC109219167 [Nicotiana attenuata]
MVFFSLKFKFIAELLSRFNMLEAKGVSTPMSTTEPLLLNNGSPPTNAKEYRQVIGALQYLTNTRPNILIAVNGLAQFMHLPSIKHWQAAKRLLSYLKQTITLELHISPSETTRLTTYSDADWGGDPDSRVSASAYIIFYGSIPVSWSFRKQHTIARSSTEAEYRAVASTVAELNWLTHLHNELHLSLKHTPIVLCENIGVTYLCKNQIFHSRMKHVAIDFHFIRDQVEKKLK